MSGDAMDWTARGRQTREGLAPLHFLVGDFEGRGTDDGQLVHAQASGRLLLDGSWLELRERLLQPDGTPIHADFTLYRFDPVEGGLRVLHFMERAWHSQYPVHLQAPGRIQWTTGVGGPKVTLVATDRGWRGQVQLPDQAEPTVLLEYHRVGSEEQGTR